MADQNEDPFYHMGICLAFVQAAEHCLADALKMAFTGTDVISVETLEAAEKDIRKNTLGKLISKLSQRAEISPDFQDLLNTFLSKRNRFVHRFTSEPEFHMGTEAGCRNVVKFTRSLLRQAVQVIAMLSGAQFAFFDELADHTEGKLGIWREVVPEHMSKLVEELIADSHHVITRKK